MVIAHGKLHAEVMKKYDKWRAKNLVVPNEGALSYNVPSLNFPYSV